LVYQVINPRKKPTFNHN